MSRPQHSKRDRGRQHEGLPPRLEPPKYGYCDDCGQAIHNVGAHAEACTGKTYPPGPVVGYGEGSGPPIRCESRAPGYGYSGVWRYCLRPWGHEGGHIYR